MQMLIFSIATLVPVVLLGLAATGLTYFGWLSVFYMTAFTAAFDRFVPRLLPEAPEGAEFPRAGNCRIYSEPFCPFYCFPWSPWPELTTSQHMINSGP